MKTPDLAEAITAWRAWHIVRTDVDELVEALAIYGVPVGVLDGGSRPALRRLTALAGRA